MATNPEYHQPNGRFKAGNPGGPGGNRRTPLITPAIFKELEKLDRVSGQTNAEVIAENVVRMAKEGEEWAVKIVVDRTEGRVREQVDATVELHRTIRLLDYDDPALKAGEDEGA